MSASWGTCPGKGNEESGRSWVQTGPLNPDHTIPEKSLRRGNPFQKNI